MSFFACFAQRDNDVKQPIIILGMHLLHISITRNMEAALKAAVRHFLKSIVNVLAYLGWFALPFNAEVDVINRDIHVFRAYAGDVCTQMQLTSLDIALDIRAKTAIRKQAFYV